MKRKTPAKKKLPPLNWTRIEARSRATLVEKAINVYHPSAAEVERSERQGDLIAQFRREI